VVIPKCGVLAQDTSDAVLIFVRKDPESSSWTIALSDIEACLGLWAFSLKRKYLQDGIEKANEI
jgi:hypothetical protein